MEDERIYYVYRKENWEEYPVGYIKGEQNVKKFVKYHNERAFKELKSESKKKVYKYFYMELKELSLDEPVIRKTVEDENSVDILLSLMDAWEIKMKNNLN